MNNCCFELDGISLQALRYGEGNPVKIIALHGWLDNAESFSLLVPHLEDFDIVVLDLAGHGQSDFRNGSGAYYIWQDLGEIFQVVSKLGWSHFGLLGHSRGAMIASLYAGCFPKQVSGLFLIDAITPLTTKEQTLPEQLAQSIRAQSIRAQTGSGGRPYSYFESFDEAVAARMRGRYPLSEEAARLLAKRSVIRENDLFYWRYDKRLLLSSDVRLSDTQVKAFVDAFQCEARVVLARDGFVHENILAWQKDHPKLQFVELEGEHHLHLSRETKTINSVANLVNEYFSSN